MQRMGGIVMARVERLRLVDGNMFQSSTFERKDSIGQDEAIWDVPVIVPLKKPQ